MVRVSWLSVRAHAAVLALLCMLLAACGRVSISTIRTAAAGRPNLSEQELLAIALRGARAAGDPTPALIQHSRGTREAANRIGSGDVVPGDGPSYLIAERGRFVLTDVSIPAGALAPRGSVLTLIVAARSHEVTDVGVSNRYPDLARLGPVTTDLRRS
jgi:hypothetical protein